MQALEALAGAIRRLEGDGASIAQAVDEVASVREEVSRLATPEAVRLLRLLDARAAGSARERTGLPLGLSLAASLVWPGNREREGLRPLLSSAGPACLVEVAARFGLLLSPAEAAAERLFSREGMWYTRRRARMTTRYASALLFLGENREAWLQATRCPLLRGCREMGGAGERRKEGAPGGSGGDRGDRGDKGEEGEEGSGLSMLSCLPGGGE